MVDSTVFRLLLSSVVLLTVAPSAISDDSVLVYETSESSGFNPHESEFTPDGEYLLVAGAWQGSNNVEQAEVRVWSMEKQAFVADHRFEGAGRILQFDIAPDGETLVLLSRPFIPGAVGEVWLYHWEHGELRRNRISSSLTPVRRLASDSESEKTSLLGGEAVFSPDASVIAIDRHEISANDWRSVVGVLRPSGSVLNLLELEATAPGMTFLNDNNTLAISTLSDIDSSTETHTLEIELSLWTCDGGAKVSSATVTDTVPRPAGRIDGGSRHTLALSPNGDFLASNGADYAIQIWNVDPLEPHLELTGFTDALTCVVFHPELNIVAAASSAQGEVGMWDVTTSEMLWNVNKSSAEGRVWIRDVDFSPDGEWLVTSGVEHGPARSEIRLWNVAELLNGADGDQ